MDRRRVAAAFITLTTVAGAGAAAIVGVAGATGLLAPVPPTFTPTTVAVVAEDLPPPSAPSTTISAPSTTISAPSTTFGAPSTEPDDEADDTREHRHRGHGDD